jgi:hypothetical protein
LEFVQDGGVAGADQGDVAVDGGEVGFDETAGDTLLAGDGLGAGVGG